MYRMRDFIFKEVIDLNGKNIGFVGDLVIDFNLKLIKGFNVISNSILKKDTNIYKNDILSLNPVVISDKFSKDEALKFHDIRIMDVVDKNQNVIGKIEDVIFYENSFYIKAFIISSGLLYDMLYGRKILSAKKLILGDKNILYRNYIDEEEKINEYEN
ncbi:uncharacterized protein YrrD [Clostridium algifaecis]|uniref:Uncharacterized protein YrrD n=2 Tax=Clostridium algifaecis TaxID=1472040 RepID=A0ABS4KNE8_9CLOT|nr:uncharacterized protein YrrD [Clostridium algifaecis]